MPSHSTTIFILAYLFRLSLAHLPQQKKHYLNMLSSKTNAFLTHTLASFWRKQSCFKLPWRLPGQSAVYFSDKRPFEETLPGRCEAQSLATNSPAPGPCPLTCGVSSECLGTRSYETTSRDQRGKIQMFFSSTGACTASKFPIANHHSQIDTQLYSASLIRLIWQQRHSDSEFDAL